MVLQRQIWSPKLHRACIRARLTRTSISVAGLGCWRLGISNVRATTYVYNLIGVLKFVGGVLFPSISWWSNVMFLLSSMPIYPQLSRSHYLDHYLPDWGKWSSQQSLIGLYLNYRHVIGSLSQGMVYSIRVGYSMLAKPFYFRWQSWRAFRYDGRSILLSKSAMLITW